MTVAQEHHRERISRLEAERDALRQQNEEVSHSLTGLPPLTSSSSAAAVPLASMSSAAPDNMDVSSPPSSSPKPPSISSSSTRPPALAPSTTLPGPLSGTGPPGQQRHAVSYPYAHSFNSTSATPFANSSGTSGEGRGSPPRSQQTPQSNVRTEGLETLSLDDVGRESPPATGEAHQQGIDGAPGT
ncbi:hypothetical protein BS47DRAFT_1345567 [Hydnum rufescens UP504]|uniref:Uncharacterized protein n=1 Tax=Hydnum rufescens UP504 TaxID=1448309 RepID=A0A9P6AUW2_9AGAM|nr:hypothetical protein BS47DRAFT_1345567 [Hydnum rufescens UP504]